MLWEEFTFTIQSMNEELPFQFCPKSSLNSQSNPTKHQKPSRTPIPSPEFKDQQSNSNEFVQYPDTIFSNSTLTVQYGLPLDNQPNNQTIKRTNKKQDKSDPKSMETKPRVKGNIKNILTSMRRMFVDFIFKDDPRTRKSHFLQKLKVKECMTLTDYELLFSRFPQPIGRLFQSKHIQRQLQLSRTKPFLVPAYMKKIKVFEKAFYQQRFPKLT